MRKRFSLAAKPCRRIVDKARQLSEESDHALAASMARCEQATARFVQGMREAILAQEAAVQHVLDLAKGIENASAAINDLTVSSRVLAVNARIEAARLGSQGKGFAVIADSLASLGGVIRNASDTVSSSIHAVRSGLPPVSAGAASMRDQTDIFVEDVGALVRSASAQADNGQGGSRIAALIELSNQALSHLQFQDPVSQKLGSIIGELEAATKRVERILKGEAQGEIEDASGVVADREPPPGEIVLF